MIFKDDITIEQYKAISSKRPILPQLICKAKHHLLHEHNGASVFSTPMLQNTVFCKHYDQFFRYCRKATSL